MKCTYKRTILSGRREIPEVQVVRRTQTTTGRKTPQPVKVNETHLGHGL